MSKITIYCQRELKSIACIYVYIGTYHACNHVINGAITRNSCSDFYKICQEEMNKHEYYDCR